MHRNIVHSVPEADKVALCCMLAMCRVFEPHTQQSCLSFPAECQFPGPPLGEKKKKKKKGRKMLKRLLKLKENMWLLNWNTSCIHSLEKN